MTTIAWDGKTLAADSRCTSSGLPYRVNKCCRLSDGMLFAGAGTMSAYDAVRQWLENKGPRPEALKDFTGLLIDTDSSIWLMDETANRYEIFASFFAIGSGRDFAIAAMALGKSALEAVELASRFDVWTGGPLVELPLKERSA